VGWESRPKQARARSGPDAGAGCLPRGGLGTESMWEGGALASGAVEGFGEPGESNFSSWWISWGSDADWILGQAACLVLRAISLPVSADALSNPGDDPGLGSEPCPWPWPTGDA
jgi:hypothetical protein